jgi:hypothetical protein
MLSNQYSQFFKEGQVLVAEYHVIHFGYGVVPKVKDTAKAHLIPGKMCILTS